MARFTADEADRYVASAELWLRRHHVVEAAPADVAMAAACSRRFGLGLRLPDAIHIAIGRRVGATLLRLDKRQLDGAEALGVDASDPFK